MERSNLNPSDDPKSTSNTRSASSANPFAYQTRLLERTASLSRSNSLSSRFPPPAGSTTSSVARKWNPSHRLSASTDTLRMKWEERIKTEHTGDNNSPSAMSTYPQPSNVSNTASFAESPTRISRKSDNNSQFASSTTDPHVPPELRQNSARYKTPPTFKRHSISAATDGSYSYNIQQDPSRYALKGSQRLSTHSLSPASGSSTTLESLGSANDQAEAFSHNRGPEPIGSTVNIRPDSEVGHFKSTFNRQESSNSTRVPSISRSPPFPKREDASSSSNNSSVMSPTPFRSSFMNNRKSNTYGPNFGSGSRLGRHLPRIASGDGNDMPDNTHSKEDQEEGERAKQQAERVRERQERRRKWDIEHGRIEPLASSPTKALNNESELVMPGSAGLSITSEVQGLRGRRRLLKSNTTPKHVTPLPTARLLGGGTWADTQRHLIQAYEYLCHVGEAQQWIEGCLDEELGFGVVEMEEGLRNGVVLAKLVRALEGDVYVRRIYEASDLSIFLLYKI